MNIDIYHLRTVHNFALSLKRTSAHIYKMIAEGRIKSIEIDGIKFIDISQTKGIDPLKTKKQRVTRKKTEN